jgi:hypothetical protein
VIQGDTVEKAVTDSAENSIIGLGSHLVTVKLSRRLPNWVPMFGMKVKLSYKGGWMACKSCFSQNKMEFGCIKRKWSYYATQFKAENKDIDECMINRSDDPNQVDCWLKDITDSPSGTASILPLSDRSECSESNFNSHE